jgi:hypothetical protein
VTDRISLFSGDNLHAQEKIQSPMRELALATIVSINCAMDACSGSVSCQEILCPLLAATCMGLASPACPLKATRVS